MKRKCYWPRREARQKRAYARGASRPGDQPHPEGFKEWDDSKKDQWKATHTAQGHLIG